MTNWKEITINTTVEVSELLSIYLNEAGSDGVSIDRENPENNIAIIKAYFQDNTLNIDSMVKEIKNKLTVFSNSGLNIGSGEVSESPIKEEDWGNDWKKYFDIFHLGKRLVVRPIWCEYLSKKGEVVINFDPGGFFGSTPHPSTRLCLEEIEEFSDEIKSGKDKYNILDLGSGSGILSLALYLLGFKNITAIDIDPVAIRTSDENFRINNMDLNLFLGELKDCHETYDLIAGNLLAEIIEELSTELSQKLNKGGVFIGAGITRQKEYTLTKSLENVGIFIEKKRYFEEWVLIRAVKK
jgi:ribosomal protein L11 methyltransferase